MNSNIRLCLKVLAGQGLPRRHLAAVGVSHLVRVLHPCFGGSLEEHDDLSIGRILAARPERPHERQSRHGGPFGTQIDFLDARRQVGEERGIADEQRGVGAGRACGPGPDRCGSQTGSMLNRRAQRIFSSATDVRDEVSSAIERTSDTGVRVNSATEATAPSDPMQTPGTTRSCGRVRYEIDGTIPKSIAPSASNDAQTDGTSNLRLTRSDRASRP